MAVDDELWNCALFILTCVLEGISKTCSVSWAHRYGLVHLHAIFVARSIKTAEDQSA